MFGKADNYSLEIRFSRGVNIREKQGMTVSTGSARSMLWRLEQCGGKIT
jgi:hypothetical protein